MNMADFIVISSDSDDDENITSTSKEPNSDLNLKEKSPSNMKVDHQPEEELFHKRSDMSSTAVTNTNETSGFTSELRKHGSINNREDVKNKHICGDSTEVLLQQVS